MKNSNNKGGKNNPGNIVASTIQWGGEVTQPGDRFESFATVDDGIRAMYNNLMAYRNVHGIKTLHDIIYRWAPPTDGNDTEGYIKMVSTSTGISPTAILSPVDYQGVISAMSKVEGNTFVTPEQVTNATKNL